MDREKLAENIQTFMPFIFKRVMKPLPNLEVSKQQLGLLFHIGSGKGNTMSYYSEKMMIPKSNITVMADKLIKEGYIERVFDPDDRRVIILNITEKGKDYLRECKETIGRTLVKRFDALSDADVKRLNELIEEMKSIFRKLDE